MMIFPNVSVISAQDNEVQNVDVKGEEITFTYQGDNIDYNTNTEVLTINNTTIVQLETVVESSLLSHEEALAMDKEAILEKFTALQNNHSISTYSYSVTGIPADAPYVVETNFSKNIAQIVADGGTALRQISDITNILFSCPAIPYASILKAVSTGVGVTGAALQAASTVMTGTWKYQIQRTKRKYTVGITSQYGRRYAHASLSIGVKISALGINKTVSSSYSSIKGGWWVSEKPF